MRVSVIGAGIGGLALARARHRADIDVAVHDTDTRHEVRDDGRMAGRIPLGSAARRRLPGLLDGGPGLASGPRGVGVFLTVQDPPSGSTVDPATCRDVAAITGAPALVAHSLAVLRGWSADRRGLIADTDPGSAAFFGYHSCDPDGDLMPWPAGPVTAPGDAVHPMPPLGSTAARTGLPALVAWHRVRETVEDGLGRDVLGGGAATVPVGVAP